MEATGTGRGVSASLRESGAQRSLIFGAERAPKYRNNLRLNAYSRLRVFGGGSLAGRQVG
jgi:hypothetical protein